MCLKIGYQVIDNLGFASVEEGIEAAMKAQADIVVIDRKSVV